MRLGRKYHCWVWIYNIGCSCVSLGIVSVPAEPAVEVLRGWMSCWCLQNMGCRRMGCPVACWVNNAASGDERVVGVCWVWERQERVLMGWKGGRR